MRDSSEALLHCALRVTHLDAERAECVDDPLSRQLAVCGGVDYDRIRRIGHLFEI